MNRSCLALIPARGGSKGIPGKNLAPVAGRPLIAWTIATAMATRGLDRVVVTTDSTEIARVARELGAEVPFRRPPELARDATPGIDPVLHAVRWLESEEGYRSDLVMLLQPTSPLRSVADIESALELLDHRGTDAVVGVTAADHHPYWTKEVSEEGYLVDFQKLESVPTRRQDLPPVFAINGAMYLVRRETLLALGTLFPERTRALVMPPERSLDIDSAWQLQVADLILKDAAANV